MTDTFVYLEDGDLARLTPAGFEIFDAAGNPIERAKTRLTSADDQGDRGGFEHYMLKEIYEQPTGCAIPWVLPSYRISLARPPRRFLIK